MKPVERAPPGSVEVPQVIWKGEHEPELLSNLEMKIGENIEREIQLLCSARVYRSISGVRTTIRAPSARTSESISFRASSSMLQ